MTETGAIRTVVQGYPQQPDRHTHLLCEGSHFHRSPYVLTWSAPPNTRTLSRLRDRFSPAVDLSGVLHIPPPPFEVEENPDVSDCHHFVPHAVYDVALDCPDNTADHPDRYHDPREKSESELPEPAAVHLLRLFDVGSNPHSILRIFDPLTTAAQALQPPPFFERQASPGVPGPPSIHVSILAFNPLVLSQAFDAGLAFRLDLLAGFVNHSPPQIRTPPFFEPFRVHRRLGSLSPGV
jgi:hypothetical protein